MVALGNRGCGVARCQKKNSELLQVVATHNDKLLAAKEAHNSIREEAAAAAEDAFREQLKAVERQREKQMDNLKEQSQYFLQKRTKELQDMAAHHERFRAEAEEKYADLTAQSNYVVGGGWGGGKGRTAGLAQPRGRRGSRSSCGGGLVVPRHVPACRRV